MMADAGRTLYPTLVAVAEELRGPRVVARRHVAGDADELFAALEASRERLAPWLRFPDALRSLEDTRDWLIRREAYWLLREVLSFAVRHGQTGSYLGNVELHHIDWELRAFTLGYWLTEGAEGQGYMSEAVRLVTEYAFSGLAASKVGLRCDARNARSQAVAERLGFVCEGRLRSETRAKDGSLADELCYALIRDDPRWPEPR
ncbi:MAG TPA: GNAT family N-acetyltransferase [Ktedonobacterales bacterium]